ncbi:MAG: RNA 2'-phosphotransferase [Oscillospiraceae bacterium]|nr:RNA 2'-phosphotransferase [Oscillospiraceae bacterium]
MDYIKLSKEISYALRHAPWEYELELDKDGFVQISQLIDALNNGDNYGRTVTIYDLTRINAESDKKRFEIKDDRIRALYGHTIPMHISKEIVTPPNILYHGTTYKAANLILDTGLKPMRRQYVHLSVDIDTAERVGRRRDGSPVILKVDAAKASADGIIFYEGNDKVVLADFVPGEYISRLK